MSMHEEGLNLSRSCVCMHACMCASEDSVYAVSVSIHTPKARVHVPTKGTGVGA